MKALIKNNLNLLVIGFGCCRQEIYAAGSSLYDIRRFGINFVNIPEEADVLVIQGFFNITGIKRALNIYNKMDFPKWTIAFGRCILSENIFGCNKELFEEFKNKIDIDVYVPGCPPRPEAFIYSVLRIIDKV